MEVVGVVCREPKFRGGGSAGAGVPVEGIWGAGDGVLVLGVKLCPKVAPRNQEQGQSWASWTPAPSLELLYPKIAPKPSTARGQQRGTWLSIPAPHPHLLPPLFQPFTVPTWSALVHSSGILQRHFSAPFRCPMAPAARRGQQPEAILLQTLSKTEGSNMTVHHQLLSALFPLATEHAALC